MVAGFAVAVVPGNERVSGRGALRGGSTASGEPTHEVLLSPRGDTQRGGALDDLVRAGKVRYIGASNFAAWQLCRSNDLAEMLGWEQFVTVQPHYHMLERKIEHELVPYCAFANIGILPYFPLAGGFLTGKYKRGEPIPVGSRAERSPYVQKYLTDANFDKLDKLRAFADSRGRTLHDLAFAWLLSNKQVSSVIAGVTNPEQVTANAATIGWTLASEELTELKELLA